MERTDLAKNFKGGLRTQGSVTKLQCIEVRRAINWHLIHSLVVILWYN